MRVISCPVLSGEVAVQQRAINRGTGLYHDLPADWQRNPSNHASSAPQVMPGCASRASSQAAGVTAAPTVPAGCPSAPGRV
jgi:hypothetical protein